MGASFPKQLLVFEEEERFIYNFEKQQ